MLFCNELLTVQPGQPEEEDGAKERAGRCQPIPIRVTVAKAVLLNLIRHGRISQRTSFLRTVAGTPVRMQVGSSKRLVTMLPQPTMQPSAVAEFLPILTSFPPPRHDYRYALPAREAVFRPPPSR